MAAAHLAETIGAGRAKQAVDLAPGEKDKTRQKHEHAGRVVIFTKRQYGETVEAESDEHRCFTADGVGQPAEERARHALSARLIDSANVSAGTVMPI